MTDDVPLPSDDVKAQRRGAYERLVSRISEPPPGGHGFVPTNSGEINWSPLTVPLSEATISLISTAGVHLKSQEPFDVYRHEGDWSSRTILGDVSTAELTVTHTHYDTRDALDDVNVIFPLDRLRELVAAGRIGRVAPRHYGLMGFIPDPGRLLSETVPPIVDELSADNVDLVLLTGG